MARVKISIRIFRYYNPSLKSPFVMQFTILGYDLNHTIYSFTMSCQKIGKEYLYKTIMKCFSCCMDLERNYWHELHTIISLVSYTESITRYCNTSDKKYKQHLMKTLLPEIHTYTTRSKLEQICVIPQHSFQSVLFSCIMGLDD